MLLCADSIIVPQYRRPSACAATKAWGPQPRKAGSAALPDHPVHLYVVSQRPLFTPIDDDCYYTGPELEERLGIRLPFWRTPDLPWRMPSVQIPGRRLALYRVGDVLDWLDKRSSGS